MPAITISGSKLYRSLWVTIGHEQYEMEGRFAPPAGSMTEPQLAVVRALAFGAGIKVAEDGTITLA